MYMPYHLLPLSRLRLLSISLYIQSVWILGFPFGLSISRVSLPLFVVSHVIDACIFPLSCRVERWPWIPCRSRSVSAGKEH